MDKGTFKKYILLATYIILIYLCISHLNVVAESIGYILGILKPIIWGIGIAFVMNVLLRVIEGKLLKKLEFKNKRIKNLKRVLSILLTYLAFAAFITILINVISPQVAQSIRSLAAEMPGYLTKAHDWVTQLGIDMGISDDIWSEIMNLWNQFEISLGSLIKNAATVAVDITINFTKGLFNFAIGVILAAYLLYSKERLIISMKKLCCAYIKPRVADRILEIAKEANVTFGRFIGGQLLEGIIIGVLCFIGMLIINIPYAPLISVLVGVTSLIPVLGAYLGGIPSTLIILMESPIKALVFVIFLIVLQRVEGDIIYPRVVGNAIGLNGLWVFIAIIVGGSVAGVMGMLIGVPLMAVIYSVVRSYTQERLKKKQIPKEKFEL